jgi:hypothetical protein
MEGEYHKKGRSFINFSELLPPPDQPLVKGAALRVLFIGFALFKNGSGRF